MYINFWKCSLRSGQNPPKFAWQDYGGLIQWPCLSLHLIDNHGTSQRQRSRTIELEYSIAAREVRGESSLSGFVVAEKYASHWYGASVSSREMIAEPHEPKRTSVTYIVFVDKWNTHLNGRPLYR